MKKGNLAYTVVGSIAGFTLVDTIRRGFARYSFRNKNVLITGGSRGLGLVLARELAKEGASLAICARDVAELERARAELERQGARVVALPCDMTVRGEVEEMVGRARLHLGSVDALINNAGVIQVGPLEEMTCEDYEISMRTHFWGPYYAIQSVLPEMQRRGEGRIINISSIGGKIAVPHLLPYTAGKFALTGFSEGLAAELLKDNIVVTTVIPWLMRTGSPRNAHFKGKYRKEYTWFTLGDSLPLLSMSARTAARRILAASRRGDRELLLGALSKTGTFVHGLFPGLTATVLGLVNLFLPAPDGTRRAVRGSESETPVTRSVLTTLNDRAAKRNNEWPESA